MKRRLLLIALTMLVLTVLIAPALSADETPDPIVYMPLITDFSDLLYWDDFSDSGSGWPVEEIENMRLSYQNGEYEIRIQEKNQWAGARAPISGLNNYTVEAKMRRTEGTESDYALIFDAKDWNNYYYFIVDPNYRWYGVAKVINGTRKIVIGRTETNAINPDQETNHLRIDRNGDEIAVSINDIPLKKAIDKEFQGDLTVGLYMESDSDSRAVSRFDDFKVWQLGNSTSQSVDTTVQFHTDKLADELDW